MQPRGIPGRRAVAATESDDDGHAMGMTRVAHRLVAVADPALGDFQAAEGVMLPDIDAGLINNQVGPEVEHFGQRPF